MDDKKVKRNLNPGIPEALHPEIGNGVALAGNTHEFLLRSPDPSKTLDEYLPDASSVFMSRPQSTSPVLPPGLRNDAVPPVESIASDKTESADNETISIGLPESIATPLPDDGGTPVDAKKAKSKKKEKNRRKEMPDPGMNDGQLDINEVEEKSAKAGKLLRKAAKSVKKQEDHKLQPVDQEHASSETSLSPYTQWLKSLAGSEYVHPYEDDFALAQGGGPSGEGISETFADLLAGQGYKEQAIEMYMKLMEKYPEKSGFFAAKIEALQ